MRNSGPPLTNEGGLDLVVEASDYCEDRRRRQAVGHCALVRLGFWNAETSMTTSLYSSDLQMGYLGFPERREMFTFQKKVVTALRGSSGGQLTKH